MECVSHFNHIITTGKHTDILLTAVTDRYPPELVIHTINTLHPLFVEEWRKLYCTVDIVSCSNGSCGSGKRTYLDILIRQKVALAFTDFSSIFVVE